MKIRQGKDQYPLPIGMLIGYHVVETKEDQIQVPRFGGQRPAGGDTENGPPSPDERNTGFGVVVPIERALEIVEREDVRANMAKAVEAGKRAKGFRSAAASLPAEEKARTDQSGEYHRERFKNLLDAAVKRPKSSD